MSQVFKRIPKLQVPKRRLAKYLLFFFAIQFAAMGFDLAMVTLFNLDPVLMSGEERLAGVETYVMFAITPFYVMVEELLFRVWPYWVLKSFLKEKKLVIAFLIIAAIYPTLIHQGNVVSGSIFARLEYFIHLLPSAVCLAWVYLKGRFWASWTLHYTWNLFLFMLALLLPLF